MTRTVKIIRNISAAALLSAGSLFLCPARPAAEENTVITTIHVGIQPLHCGTVIENGGAYYNGPRFELTADDPVHFKGQGYWILRDDKVLDYFSGTVVGGEVYRAGIKLEAEPGYTFDQSVKIAATDLETGANTDRKLLEQSDTEITIWVECTAQHNWGEWTLVSEPSKRADGVERRECAVCGYDEARILPRITIPYTDVYEPDTSWAMSATVAWRADQTVLETAQAEVRPATAFVWLDSGLKVYDRNGVLLSDSIDAYIESTSQGVIPAFYIKDAAASSALKMWLQESGLVDCFVVSDPAHKYLVKDVADLTFVRGMLDYSSYTELSRSDITDMAAAVNGAHGKTVILSQEAASRENVQKLQRLAATVWVKTASDTRSLLTMYTNGVNGVVVDDYLPALDALEFFHDDAPTLLRLPLILGHRGDPSVYPENTLESARGAYREGADAVENDIQLSADGQLFILHDTAPTRLLRLREYDENGNIYPAEHYTLAELQAHPFDWEDICEYNEVNANSSRDGVFYGQKEKRQYRVPTLEDYIREFQGTSLIHDTEIKSSNPDILPVFKELVDKYDAWDQFFCITFNAKILNAIYSSYPEISIGMLTNGTTDSPFTNMEGKHSFQEITEQEGTGTALLALYSVIDQYNATYNPSHLQYGEEMAKAGRHRGLTVWPWTYLGSDKFAHDFLRGVHGMTVDNAWILSDHIKEIRAEDITAASESDVEKPVGITRTGEEKILEDAELVRIEDISGTERLMIWRCRAPMDLNGENYGSYYLYSNPFVLTIGSAAAAEESGGSMVPALAAVIICVLAVGIAAVLVLKKRTQDQPPLNQRKHNKH